MEGKPEDAAEPRRMAEQGRCGRQGFGAPSEQEHAQRAGTGTKGRRAEFGEKVAAQGNILSADHADDRRFMEKQNSGLF